MRRSAQVVISGLTVAMLISVACGGGKPDAARGEKVYNERCWNCHEKDTAAEGELGPGLKDYWKRSPHKEQSGSEHTHTDEYVLNFLRNGSRNMPPQDFLPRQELEDLVAYLKTL